MDEYHHHSTIRHTLSFSFSYKNGHRNYVYVFFQVLLKTSLNQSFHVRGGGIHQPVHFVYTLTYSLIILFFDK